MVYRGARLVHPTAHRASRNAEGPTLTVAGEPLSSSDETKHFKFLGTTGTGKSTAIRELLRGALARGDRAIIADPDGGYLKTFYNPTRGDVILNPFDPRAARWDLLAELIQLHDADQLARSIIPDYDGTDRNWRHYARTFLTAVLRQLHRAEDHDFARLYYLLLLAPSASSSPQPPPAAFSGRTTAGSSSPSDPSPMSTPPPSSTSLDSRPANPCPSDAGSERGGVPEARVPTGVGVGFCYLDRNRGC